MGYDWDTMIMNGSSLTDLSASIPVTKKEVDAYDVTIVVCMVNPPQGGCKQSVFQPGSDQGALLLKLCRQLRAHKRPVCIIGGDAQMWSMPEKWNVMVRQFILICRSQGVIAIDGVHYLQAMENAMISGTS